MSEDVRVPAGSDPDGASTPEVDALSAQFRRSDLDRHLAFFYDSPAWQLQVAATFVAAGLDRGNRCLYFVDTNPRSAVERALTNAGVDVDARVAAGDLAIRDGCEAYQEAAFDPSNLISLLTDATDESVADGYDGLWVAGEVSWCFHTDLDYDHVVDFEAEFDAACSDVPVTSLCQYDMAQFSEESIAKALWTHSQVVYRDRICENPFYVPPEEFRSGAPASVNARLMLEQAYQLSEANQQTERREQRLAVVDRILRHDIRNHLNITLGLIDHVRDAAALDEDARTKLTTAADYVDSVVATANKARYIQRTLGASSVLRRPVRLLVDSAVEQVASDHPDATLRIRGDTDVAVVADQTFDVALAELLRYALDRQESPGQVVLHVAEHAVDAVRIDVSYPGPPIPDNDRRALQEGVETPLTHCTGVGLWLVKWTVENSNGHVDFPDAADAPIRLLLNRATNDR